MVRVHIIDDLASNNIIRQHPVKNRLPHGLNINNHNFRSNCFSATTFNFKISDCNFIIILV